jgi:uncharacterized membrane protein
MDFQGIKIMEPVGFFRFTARNALRHKWGIALGAGLLYMILANLPVVFLDFFLGGGTAWNQWGENYTSLTGPIAIQDSMNISISSAVVGLIYMLLTSGALALGISIFCLNVIRNGNISVGLIFSGFGNFIKSLGMMVLLMLMLCGIGLVGSILISIIFVSIGIVAVTTILSVIIAIATVVAIAIISLYFALCFFVLADNPRMGVISCMGLSRRMMAGNKAKFFLLLLSFIGWGILYILFYGAVSVFTSAMTQIIDSVLVSQLVLTVLESFALGLLTVYMTTAEAAFYERASGIVTNLADPDNEITNTHSSYISTDNPEDTNY